MNKNVYRLVVIGNILGDILTWPLLIQFNGMFDFWIDTVYSWKYSFNELKNPTPYEYEK